LMNACALWRENRLTSRKRFICVVAISLVSESNVDVRAWISGERCFARLPTGDFELPRVFCRALIPLSF